MKNTYLLAIETSCDDTGIAIFKNKKLLSNIITSSTNLHRKYGGIIPEIAARQHEKNILPCLNKALNQAGIDVKDINVVAYTSEPGLPGSLHVGKVFAKSLTSLLNIELIKVNHMCGHAFSFALTHNQIKYPFISLIASGGETAICLFKNKTNYQILNKTTDDAIGETLDKIGRRLNLKYPGGKFIDEIFNQSKSNLKLINHFKPEQSFSFSGLKTYVLNFINNQKNIDKVQVASSVLKWVVDEILIKLDYYTKKYKVKTITCGGGVVCNSLLRKQLLKIYKKNVLLTDKKYCIDNAAMIGIYALECL